MRIWFCVLLLPLSLQSAMASEASRPFATRCNVYNPGEPESVDAVVRRATLIVRARARSFRKNDNKIWRGENVVYQFDILHTIKGKDPGRTIELAGVRNKQDFPFDPSVLDVTFRHSQGLAKAKTVADAMVSRLAIPLADRNEYCEYAPYFDIGLEYLLILPEPYTQISFEPIITPFDAWLTRVRVATGDGASLYDDR